MWAPACRGRRRAGRKGCRRCRLKPVRYRRKGQGIGAALGLIKLHAIAPFFHGKWRFSIMLSWHAAYEKRLRPMGRFYAQWGKCLFGWWSLMRYTTFAPLEGVTGYVYRNLPSMVRRWNAITCHLSPWGRVALFRPREWQDFLPGHNESGDLVPNCWKAPRVLSGRPGSCARWGTVRSISTWDALPAP